MPFFQSNDANIYYEDCGVGEVIVFTHGHSMYHKQWEPQVQELSAHYRTIVWDVRGHGKSTLPDGKVDPKSFSNDLYSLLEHLGIEAAVLCGLSMGGHISLQTAIRYPAKVKGLILIGTPFTNAFNWYEKLTVPISLLSLRFIPYKMTASMTANLMAKINPDNRNFVNQAFAMMTPDVFLRLWEGNLRMESRRDLEKINCPTLILLGDQDKMVARQQPELRSGIQGAEFHIVERADHLTNLDNPAAVNHYIQSFMAGLARNQDI